MDDGFEYVGFGPRLLAALIDSLLFLAISAPLLASIYGWGYFLDADRPVIAGAADFLISWVFPTIATVVLWRWLGATPGKRAIGARVVDAATGDRLTTGQAVVRSLAYVVSALPLCAGFLWIAFDARRQGWHDKLARSVVLRVRRSSAGSPSTSARGRPPGA